MPDDDNNVGVGMSSDNQFADDDGSPFSPPTNDDDSKFMDHQKADTDIDETELYNEGWAGAAGEDPRGDSGVISYTPPSASDDEDSSTSPGEDSD
jgi:hypothetical protein